jgi:hypothetical protein
MLSIERGSVFYAESLIHVLHTILMRLACLGGGISGTDNQVVADGAREGLGYARRDDAALVVATLQPPEEMQRDGDDDVDIVETVGVGECGAEKASEKFS